MTSNPRGHRSPVPGVATRARTDEGAAVPATGGKPRPPRMASAWQSFLHDRSVRSRIALLVLLPLIGALVLGALVLQDTLERLQTATAVERNLQVTVAALDVAERLQDERDVSGLFDVGATGQGAVADARNATDEAIDAFNDRLAELPDDVDPAVAEARRGTTVQLALLNAYRGSRDIVLEPFDEAGVEDYHHMVNSLFRFVQASGTQSADPELVLQIGALDSLARATESGSIERGLLAHVLASGEPLSDAERQREAISRGEQDYLLARFVALAEPEVRALYYGQVPAVRGPMEEIRNAALVPDEEPDVTPEAWYEAATTRLDVFDGIQDVVSGQVLSKASEAAGQARLAAILTGALALALLAATVVLALAVARSINGPLRRLRRAALETADIELPALVSRIHNDGPAVVRKVGNAVEPEGADEIGQVANAFNDVYSTAVRVAGEQALLRQNLDTIVVNLSRRTQSLVDRQLGEIEGLESRERDPDQLGTLFRIDHLATRVRRHAESLLVLAGVEEMRRAGTAAPVLDVVRTAVGEVEQYPRVKFGVMPTDLVTAGAVDDIAHLLAELLDNATEFSAPSTQVMITSQPLLGGGLRIQIADTGLGVAPEQLAELNERLREPGDIDVAASRTLGLYVVARLAARHGILVRLAPGTPNGTLAQVDLPASIILSPLDTGDRVIPAVIEGPQPMLLDGGADGRPAREGEPTAVPPAAGTGEQLPVRPPGRPLQPVNGQLSGGQPVGQPGTNGSAAHPGARPSEESPRQPVRSLRAPEPPLPEADSPIFEQVKSAWFQSGGGEIEWSSPADEGWLRAAAALKTAEEAANARRAHASPAATASVLSEPPPPSVGDDAPPQPADELAFSSAGLPVRRRGATMIPGSIAELAGEAPGTSHEATQQDATKVASTLSNLQRGVSRGREATGGWVPKRPDDPERSDP
jgi:signal transduction histidine kinase